MDRYDELAFLPLHDAEAASLLEPLPAAERLASWRLALPDGSLAGRGAGTPSLLEAMRLTRGAGRLLRHVPPHTLDRAYDVVARNRDRLGRLVPDGQGPRRA